MGDVHDVSWRFRLRDGPPTEIEETDTLVVEPTFPMKTLGLGRRGTQRP